MTSSHSYNDYKSNNTDGSTSNVNNDKSSNVQESRKTPENKNKRVFILGDSIVKHVSGYDISRQNENCKIYAKGFSGAKTEYMNNYAQPTTRENPDHIAEDIIQLALKLKISSCDISVSNIAERNDQYRNKALTVNRKPKDLCK